MASTPSQNYTILLPNNNCNNNFVAVGQSYLARPREICYRRYMYSNNHRRAVLRFVSAAAKKKEEEEEEAETEETKPPRKQNLFESVTEALDFSQVRSAEDAQLLEDARKATKSGSKMTREQYSALRRKIGGTYKDFFKSYIDVDGEYVEEGWVDKTCKVCKKDTRGEARQVDNFGRYIHVACLDDKSKSGGNFFTRLFS